MVVAESSTDSVKLRIFNRVGFYYIFNDPERAKKMLLNAITESQRKKIPFSEAECIHFLGNKGWG